MEKSFWERFLKAMVFEVFLKSRLVWESAPAHADKNTSKEMIVARQVLIRSPNKPHLPNLTEILADFFSFPQFFTQLEAMPA
tara:strand:+ start:389 stop:634 length:246 start_codon:yes stop_codon:yes gene_type:complete